MLIGATLLSAVCRADAQPNIAWDPDSGRAVLTNGRIELVVETKSGLNPRSLRDAKIGQAYADRDYAWSMAGTSELPKMEGAPVIAESKDGIPSITFKGRLGSLAVEQVFTLPKNEPGVILEQITIGNPTDKPLDTASFRCGFAKHLREGETWSPDASGIRFCPVPYRRETNGQMQDWPLREVAEHGITFSAWMEPAHPTPIWGAEGWVWTYQGSGARGQGPDAAKSPNLQISKSPNSSGPHPNPLPKGEGTSADALPKGEATSAFLIAKFNPEGMEWSLMEPVKHDKETVLRFGGAGQWKHSHPEGATRLAPGKSYTFGETRLQAIEGDWKQAYYAYRGYFESKGRGVPKTYDPPLQWNELYDNEYFGRVCGMGDEFFGPGKPGFCPAYYVKNEELLNKYYSPALIKAEADKAKELGCEALYLDPGWEAGPSRQIWDAQRFGPMTSFVKMIREQYGMRGLCFWCSLAGVPPTIGDPSACPKEARTINKDGKPEYFLLCLPSPGFLDTKEKNLLDLCRDGAQFLMFDSNQYSGPCYDKTHGHSIPSTREEHAKALFELARRVKVKYPNVLIEMHDPITGPCNIHYTPSYFGYCPPTSFDCLWGHEFMWNSMDDLLSGRAVSLYYYNLAYSIPLYLHVGLNTDNENALVFWWYASTCRHLGVGGKSKNPAVWEAQKRAVRTYLPLKRFYTQGKFYGIEETVHAHTLPELGQSVINIFNLTDKPVEKSAHLRPADVGLSGDSIRVEGESFTAKGGDVTFKVTVPARGHQLVKVKAE
jgi:hypothetical protein